MPQGIRADSCKIPKQRTLCSFKSHQDRRVVNEFAAWDSTLRLPLLAGIGEYIFIICTIVAAQPG